MHPIRVIKNLWRGLLLLVMVVALVACGLLVGLNWERKGSEPMHAVFGEWKDRSLGSVIGVGILLGMFSWLMLSRLPKIMRAGKIEKQKQQQERNAQEAEAWRRQQAAPKQAANE